MSLIVEKIDKYLSEVLGRGTGHVLKLKKEQVAKAESILKNKKIKYTKDTNGNLVVGDDDYDNAEEMLARNGIY